MRWLVLVVLLEGALSERILLLSTLPSPSHSYWYNQLAALLARRGHQVVILDTEPPRKQIDNVTFIFMDSRCLWKEDIDENAGSDSQILEDIAESHSFFKFMNLHLSCIKDCENLMLSQSTLEFIKGHKGAHFDLIVIDMLCENFLGFVPYFGNPPTVIATPFYNLMGFSNPLGLYENPSYVPQVASPFLSRMTFLERVANTFYYAYSHLLVNLYIRPLFNDNMRDVFGPSTPPITDIIPNISLCLINSHFALNGAQPLSPNIISVGGFHIHPPKPLPKEIKDFLDGAKDGAVYFSFGTNIKSSAMSSAKTQMFLEAFKEIKQRVLWKTDIKFSENLPSNIMTASWIHQNDVLGHENVVCFISHGGLLGIQESVYHGVPMIGVPFMIDQFNNIRNLEIKGTAIFLNYNHLNKTIIKETIETIIYNTSYGTKMKELSRIFRDNSESPKDRALFWLEYAMRNPSNDLIKPLSLNLYWFQLILLDVLVTAATLALGFFIGAHFLIKSILLIKDKKKRKIKHR